MELSGDSPSEEGGGGGAQGKDMPSLDTGSLGASNSSDSPTGETSAGPNIQVEVRPGLDHPSPPYNIHTGGGMTRDGHAKPGGQKQFRLTHGGDQRRTQHTSLDITGLFLHCTRGQVCGS